MKYFYTFLLLFIVNYSFAQCPANEADLANGGTFSGTCTVNVGANINITGAVILTSGTLTIDGNGGAGNVTINSAGGSITIQSGASIIIDDGRLAVGGGGSFTSSGDLSINDGILITG